MQYIYIYIYIYIAYNADRVYVFCMYVWERERKRESIVVIQHNKQINILVLRIQRTFSSVNWKSAIIFKKNINKLA